jgi:hypothetical protein
MILGGVRVAGSIASSISAEAFKALIRFGEDKYFASFTDPDGDYFTNFADFLNKSPYSPMTKTQFYARKTLFDKEGERLFDIYGELGLSIRKRKLLGKGNVEIDGDNVVIHDAEGVETIIPIDDQARLMEVVTAVVDSKIDLQNRFDRQQKTIDGQKKTIQNAHADIDKIKAPRVAEFAADAHMMARLELGLAFAKFTKIAADLSPVEKDQFRDSVLEDVAAWRGSLAAAYKGSPPYEGGVAAASVDGVVLSGSTLDDTLDNFLAGADLDAADDNRLAEML